eukprot:tig00021146_g19055.t1
MWDAVQNKGAAPSARRSLTATAAVDKEAESLLVRTPYQPIYEGAVRATWAGVRFQPPSTIVGGLADDPAEAAPSATPSAPAPAQAAAQTAAPPTAPQQARPGATRARPLAEAAAGRVTSGAAGTAVATAEATVTVAATAAVARRNPHNPLSTRTTHAAYKRHENDARLRGCPPTLRELFDMVWKAQYAEMPDSLSASARAEQATALVLIKLQNQMDAQSASSSARAAAPPSGGQPPTGGRNERQQPFLEGPEGQSEAGPQSAAPSKPAEGRASISQAQERSSRASQAEPPRADQSTPEQPRASVAAPRASAATTFNPQADVPAGGLLQFVRECSSCRDVKIRGQGVTELGLWLQTVERQIRTAASHAETRAKPGGAQKVSDEAFAQAKQAARRALEDVCRALRAGIDMQISLSAGETGMMISLLPDGPRADLEALRATLDRTKDWRALLERERQHEARVAMQAAAKANPKPFFAVYTVAEASSPRGHEARAPCDLPAHLHTPASVRAAVPVPADEKYISIRRVQTVVHEPPAQTVAPRRQPRRPPGPTKEPRACAGLGPPPAAQARAALDRAGLQLAVEPAQMLQVDPKTLEPALRAVHQAIMDRYGISMRKTGYKAPPRPTRAWFSGSAPTAAFAPQNALEAAAIIYPEA